MPRKRWDNPTTISLFEVHDEFPYGRPPVIHTEDMTPEAVNARVANRMNQLLMEQVVKTFDAYREDPDTPQTVLQSLAAGENLSLSQIAAMLQVVPSTVEQDLGVLCEVGWVAVDDDGIIPKYSMIATER